MMARANVFPELWQPAIAVRGFSMTERKICCCTDESFTPNILSANATGLLLSFVAIGLHLCLDLLSLIIILQSFADRRKLGFFVIAREFPVARRRDPEILTQYRNRERKPSDSIER